MKDNFPPPCPVHGGCEAAISSSSLSKREVVKNLMASRYRFPSEKNVIRQRVDGKIKGSHESDRHAFFDGPFAGELGYPVNDMVVATRQIGDGDGDIKHIGNVLIELDDLDDNSGAAIVFFEESTVQR